MGRALCRFCFQVICSHDYNVEQEVQVFSNSLEGFLLAPEIVNCGSRRTVKKNTTVIDTSHRECESKSLLTCEKCSKLMTSFSDLYKRMKCLELKLNWVLLELSGVVTRMSGVEVGRRVEEFKKSNVDWKTEVVKARVVEEVEEMARLRSLIEEGARRVKKFQPTVSLQRIAVPKRENVEDGCLHESSDKRLKTSELLEVRQDFSSAIADVASSNLDALICRVKTEEGADHKNPDADFVPIDICHKIEIGPVIESPPSPDVGTLDSSQPPAILPKEIEGVNNEVENEVPSRTLRRGLRNIHRCHQCEKKFSNKSKLEEHSKTAHHGEYDDGESDSGENCDDFNPSPKEKESLSSSSSSSETEEDVDDSTNNTGSSRRKRKTWKRWRKIERKRTKVGEITSDAQAWEGYVASEYNPKWIQYRCTEEDCSAWFIIKDESTRHAAMHGKFSCHNSTCNVVKTFAPDLALHELTHSQGNGGLVPYNCLRCSFTTTKKTVYIDHHLKTHLSLELPLVSCPICLLQFDRGGRHFFGESRDYLVKHYRRAHDPSKGPLKKCDKCEARFTTASLLSRHRRAMHFEKVFKHVCSDCGKMVKTFKDLRSHRFFKHGKNPDDFQFQCPNVDCKLKVETQAELDSHVRFIHSNRTESTIELCPHCGKSFQGRKPLRCHITQAHTRTKPVIAVPPRSQRRFVCEKCGKGFKQYVTLDLHYKMHEGPESWEFKCEYCGKKCMTKHKLAEHLRTHTKEKPFVCQFCGLKYAHRHNWRAHVSKNHAGKT